MSRAARLFLISVLIYSFLSIPAFAASKGVMLNFNEVDISTMVKFISDLTGKNFVLDDRVKGKISIFSPSKLSNEEAYNIFVSVLDLKGFTVVQNGKFYKIIPSSSVRQTGGITMLAEGGDPPVNDTYIAQALKLENITAQEALAFLQPMISKDGHISAFAPGNILLIVDASSNVRKLQTILHTIDAEKTRDGVELLYLKHSSAEAAATTIRQWLVGSDSRTPQPAAGGGGGASGSVMADQRLNALLLFGSDSMKKSIREMVAKLDVPSPEASSKVNVYYLENSDATEMAKVLDSVIKGMPAQPAAGAAPQAAAPQASPFDSGKVTITPDKASNALIIMASPTDYANLLQVIKKLDRRSRQVFVQVLIAEVSLDKSRDIGLEGGVIGGGVLNKYLTVAGLYDPLGTLTTLGTSIATLNNNNLLSNIEPRPANVAAVLHAMDKNGLVNILSTPNILTSDNKEAEINVGENVPFQGSATQSTIGTTTSVERKDIGINLKIKPQISEGDFIRLDLSQEISAVKNDKGQAIDLVTTKRSTKTSIVIKDKETVVIGGLIQDTEDETVSKVPLLGDIPGLGWLFKTKNKTRKKTNLMILITPQIVRSAEELQSVTETRKNLFSDSAKNNRPLDVPVAVGRPVTDSNQSKGADTK